MLDRATLLGAIRRSAPDAVIVCQLGDTGDELRRLADHPGNLYLLGSMGMVMPVALGLALHNPRHVIAIEGDGGCLMNLGALTTLARYGPANLAVLVLDNSAYGSTGGQPSATATGTDIAGIARAAGMSTVRRFDCPGLENETARWLSAAGLRVAVGHIHGGRPAAASAEARLTPRGNAARLIVDLASHHRPRGALEASATLRCEMSAK